MKAASKRIISLFQDNYPEFLQVGSSAAIMITARQPIALVHVNRCRRMCIQDKQMMVHH
jgi:hypothetical protein